MPSVLCIIDSLGDTLTLEESDFMRRTVFLLAAITMLQASFVFPQNAKPSANSERKVSFRIEPVYPDLARKMSLHGVVKVEATVRPNGTVRSTRILGGNPVLVDAATEAVRKWKFEVGPAETIELIQLTFVPE